MDRSNNGNALKCAENLMLLKRGEVPYDRLRGISADIIDRPSADDYIEKKLQNDANWTFKRYEPRIDIAKVKVRITDAENSSGKIDLVVSDKR